MILIQMMKVRRKRVKNYLQVQVRIKIKAKVRVTVGKTLRQGKNRVKVRRIAQNLRQYQDITHIMLHGWIIVMLKS